MKQKTEKNHHQCIHWTHCGGAMGLEGMVQTMPEQHFNVKIKPVFKN